MEKMKSFLIATNYPISTRRKEVKRWKLCNELKAFMFSDCTTLGLGFLCSVKKIKKEANGIKYGVKEFFDLYFLKISHNFLIFFSVFETSMQWLN